MPDKILVASLDFISESTSLILKWFEEIKEPADYVSTFTGKSHYEATLMRPQSIGETLKKIDKSKPEFLDRYTEVNWNDIIRLREIISHHYEQISQETIFDICKHDLPVLKNTVERMLNELAEL
jgi:uncharacterized protein with HEPN domain